MGQREVGKDHPKIWVRHIHFPAFGLLKTQGHNTRRREGQRPRRLRGSRERGRNEGERRQDPTRTDGNFTVRLLRGAPPRPAPAATIRARAGVAPRQLAAPPPAGPALPARRRRLAERRAGGVPPAPARRCVERPHREPAPGRQLPPPSSGGARCGRRRPGRLWSAGGNGQGRARSGTRVRHPEGSDYCIARSRAHASCWKQHLKTTEVLFKCAVHVCHYYDFVPIPGELTVQVLN